MPDSKALSPVPDGEAVLAIVEELPATPPHPVILSEGGVVGVNTGPPDQDAAGGGAGGGGIADGSVGPVALVCPFAKPALSASNALANTIFIVLFMQYLLLFA